MNAAQRTERLDSMLNLGGAYAAALHAPRREYLTAADAATMFQISTRTLHRWTQQFPTMPVTRLGRTVRFEREALHAWLDRRLPRAARRAQQRKEG